MISCLVEVLQLFIAMNRLIHVAGCDSYVCGFKKWHKIHVGMIMVY